MCACACIKCSVCVCVCVCRRMGMFLCRHSAPSNVSYLINVLKHHREFEISMQYFKKTDDVLVLEFLKETYLPQGSTRHPFVIFV